MTPALAAVTAVFPLLPDPDQAREWAERELNDPAYRAAEPTIIDRASQAVASFIRDLLTPSDGADWGPPALIVLAILLAGGVIVALLIWGRPRRVVRAGPAARALFDGDDVRSADELRREATEAAARGSWDTAIVLRFRALARGLFERGLVDPPPGATARAFARAAGAALPAFAVSMDTAAASFDDVRYLRRPGTAEGYRAIAELDDATIRARALTDGAVAAP
ncbi:DUF4129 domain-containing protein [Microbacterium trichothecenolyticum]|uniref:Protein-glutamine gamma-glutamyltransferase-like C-terminal domain-containing protein n=1 Tax=Microbacterium trichothecenolyticum TaxID=69370 RepID=A0ABU0TTF0_MICTR|nr:DUF4129 domain-containing protein [Microbacterium trichothecenolyticum]MDQ1122934.1 hypothetical protein [Microbacterium trichothecenolyticum]